ncbi:MAG: decaprenyl-phosphate phosphoribosyltransferase [Candidatus Binatus sp.]|uniref:decaprenyl-phosphate phosphoribosyltransferase n=1 Tax=Candidatus Binatus sp. TaxID=2811406 RepID=UPI0027216E2C|nr:decaprenyl-phosphate phosphoribosyltransferase [Candidatus Binatus sp.]MDO8433339.1 decaprenyl-phosphate phosphoribosyltransferase [Candidatus Binatus sp.]
MDAAQKFPVEIAVRNPAAIVRLLRPHQWIKNGLVLAALVFSQRLFVLGDALLAALAFVAFCALSSTGYVLNDIADREADRLNPEKCDRPLARGDLSVATARRIALGLGTVALILSILLGPHFLAIAVAYIALQFAYSLWAKGQVVIDVIVVAIGFVMRAFAGGAAIDVTVSPWLAFITFVLALLLVLARRRHELILLGDGADAHRGALSQYSVKLIDQMISIVAAATLVGYMIYTASAEVEAKLGTPHLYLTVPFVAFGILRYLYLIDERNEGGDPARLLLRDRPLMLAVVLWILTDIVLLYF